MRYISINIFSFILLAESFNFKTWKSHILWQTRKPNGNVLTFPEKGTFIVREYPITELSWCWVLLLNTHQNYLLSLSTILVTCGDKVLHTKLFNFCYLFHSGKGNSWRSLVSTWVPKLLKWRYWFKITSCQAWKISSR